MSMNLEIKRDWIEALRSGRYKQGLGSLRSLRSFGMGEVRYCCLGVLCELAVEVGQAKRVATDGGYVDLHSHSSTGILPRGVSDWAGLSSQCPRLREGRLLDRLNDEGVSFREIAALIEADEDF